MSTASPTRRIAPTGWLAIVLAAALATPCRGEAGGAVCPTADGAAGPLTNGREMVGLRGCANCHAVGRPGDSIFLNAVPDEPWVLRNEQQTWEKQGRHYQAYGTLLGDRSRRMGEVLGVDDVSLDARCVACHASAPIEWIEPGADAIAALRDSELKEVITAGVSCEGCHGAAGSVKDGLEGWETAHVAGDPDAWRHLTPAEKQDGFGYYDVRSPSSRARMCVSCHIGDPERGRVVTHAMYAAGHPPLPAFEVETFLRDMPPHWRVLGPAGSDGDPADTVPGKGDAVSREFIENTDDPYFAAIRDANPDAYAAYRARYDRTRSLAVGAIVTWAQGARVTAALASERDYPVSVARDRWPELAAFECSACHHDLRLDAWRAERSPPTTPGRPLLRDWSSPLFRAVCASLTKQNRTPRVVAAMTDFLDSATRDDPYGDRDVIASRLNKAAAEADGWAAKVERRAFQRRDAQRLLRAIAAVAAEREIDYESARNLMWGFEEVLRELAEKGGSGGGLAEAADRFDAVKRMFVTDLASSDMRSSEDVAVRGVERPFPTQKINLAVVHERAAAYDARRFRAGFVQVAAAIE